MRSWCTVASAAEKPRTKILNQHGERHNQPSAALVSVARQRIMRVLPTLPPAARHRESAQKVDRTLVHYAQPLRRADTTSAEIAGL